MRAITWRDHFAYLRYVVRHKVAVFDACKMLDVPLWRAIIHDWTKLLPCEWMPYVRWFYALPKVGETVDTNSFEGWGGPAVVVETRSMSESRNKVRLIGEGGSAEPFWCFDFEVEGMPAASSAFDAAWLHHQKRNLHHWQAWLLIRDTGETVAMPMPETYAKEMIADWSGAGLAITGNPDPREWYLRNRDKINLESTTRNFVERALAHWWGEDLEASGELWRFAGMSWQRYGYLAAEVKPCDALARAAIGNPHTAAAEVLMALRSGGSPLAISGRIQLPPETIRFEAERLVALGLAVREDICGGSAYWTTPTGYALADELDWWLG